MKNREQLDSSADDSAVKQSDDSDAVAKNEQDSMNAIIELEQQLAAREKAFKEQQEKFEAEKLAFDQQSKSLSVQKPLEQQPLEGEIIEANPILPKRVTLKCDHSFQVGMPSRPDLLVTLSFVNGQIVKDPQTIKTLVETGAPISIG